MTAKSVKRNEVEITLRLVDTHCHLDDESFDGELDGVLDRATALGVTRWINVGYSPERWASSIELANRYAGMSHMLGLHPGHADLWSPAVRDELRKAIKESQPVAIGEIGLDFFRGETNESIQLEAFTAQLAIAREFGLPVAIHMRDSEPLLLETLRAETALPQILFHSFDGTAELTDWIIESGSYIGVGGLATRKKSAELRTQIARIPIDQIVLETDSPYLVPNGFKHRRNTPESIPFIAKALADLFQRDVADIARITTANAERLFERLPVHD
jgi:TatD DNase family protein